MLNNLMAYMPTQITDILFALQKFLLASSTLILVGLIVAYCLQANAMQKEAE